MQVTPIKVNPNESKSEEGNEEDKVQVVQLTPMSDPTSSNENMSEIINNLDAVNTSGHPSANPSNSSSIKQK